MFGQTLVLLGAAGLLTDLKVFRAASGRVETWFPSAASEQPA